MRMMSVAGSLMRSLIHLKGYSIYWISIRIAV